VKAWSPIKRRHHDCYAIGLWVSFDFCTDGALAASRAQLDLIGFAFIACLKALGGGTLRDILLDRPVFWIESPQVLGISLSATFLVFLTATLMESRYKWLLWLDSFALAIAVPAGVAIATSLNQSAPVVIIMGMTTATMGGLMRDVVCNEAPLVLKQGELYVSAAFGGATAAIIALKLGLPLSWSLIICSALTWILRSGSIQFGCRMPVYRSRPPKEK
jgi:uncharacterized membrane protein YeiH